MAWNLPSSSLSKMRLLRTTVLTIAASFAPVAAAPIPPAVATAAAGVPYPCEPDLLEVLFRADSRVRLRDGALQDLAAPALDGVDAVLADLDGHEWLRICDVPEETLDELRARGEARSGTTLYDLNDIYRLRVAGGADPWEVGRRLEALPGVLMARPVPLPQPLPLPPDLEDQQGYAAPSGWTPTGLDYLFPPGWFGGDGFGIHVVDIEYDWDYDHADLTLLPGSQIITTACSPACSLACSVCDSTLLAEYRDHGTAVAGLFIADDNGWGTTGVARGATFITCAAYFGSPSPSWNVPGAITTALSFLTTGDVLLLEQQWDYGNPGTPDADFIPIEWWLNYWPGAQTMNAVYAALQTAEALGIHVVEAGGNGNVDTGALTWFGNSEAIIVGAGGAYPGGTHGGTDLERLAFSSYGPRFDVQAWGEDVVTTGYGDLYNEGATVHYDYTDRFAGTSSASALVAAAVACYSGYNKVSLGMPRAPAQMRVDLASWSVPQFFGLGGNIGPRPDLLPLVMRLQPPPYSSGGDYGDAPEGTEAYPSLLPPGTGNFPTLLNSGPSGSVFHVRQGTPQLYLGYGLDYEYEGNGGLRFGPFLQYDADECEAAPPGSADKGLVQPQNYTIQGGVVVSCDTGPAAFLGGACDTAHLGTDFDILVTNDRAFDAYLNVLFDWDHNGIWLGDLPTCNGFTSEWAIQNLPVSPTGSTPVLLSTIAAAAVPISADTGYVWTRFTLSDLPVTPAGGLNWDGSNTSAGWVGVTPIGETEDYLLRVDAGPVAVAEGDPLPAVTGLASCVPNPFQGRTAIRFGLARDANVQLSVYDVRGRLVRRLVSGRVAAGSHATAWNGMTESGRPAAAGVYFVEMRSDGVRETRKIALRR